MPWENGRKPQGKSGDSLPSCLPGYSLKRLLKGPRARQVHLRVPCPEIPGGKPEGPAGGEDRGCFLRQQGKIRRPPCHRGPAERRGEGQPQEGPENHAQAGPEGEEVGKIAANLLARGFTAEGPDRKFVTDVTEFKLPDGKLYLSPVMDLYSRRIVGYSISPRPDFAQIRERMENAFGGREGKVRGALFHSDQGWQYQRKEFGDILKGYGRIQTMSRKGNCHDNSVMENFFGGSRPRCSTDRKTDTGTTAALRRQSWSTSTGTTQVG